MNCRVFYRTGRGVSCGFYGGAGEADANAVFPLTLLRRGRQGEDEVGRYLD
jgi:hypothetical protein